MKTLRSISFIVVCCFLLFGVGLAAAQEAIVLRQWDLWPSSPQSDVIEQLNAEFEENHPGVTIERTTFSFDQLKAVTKLALASEEGPDVTMVNQGYPDMGAYVAADLLLSLNDYAEQYGWNTRWAQTLLLRNSFSEDGSQFGVGNLYGVSTTAEFGGIYYHKDMFTERGLEPPTSWAELVNVLDTFANDNVRPLSIGMIGHQDMHYYVMILHAFNDVDWVNDYIYRLNDAHFDTPENIEAAAVAQEWAAKYLPEDFAGLDRETARSLFYAKEFPMLIEGSWLGGNVVENNLGDEVGFFLIPHHTDGHVPVIWGGWSTAWSIRRSTAYPDLAAEFLDWHSGVRAAEVWAGIGDIPAVGLEDRSAIQHDLQLDLLNAWDELNANNSIGHYLDWASPTMYDTLNAQLDLLEAGQIKPEDFAAAIQEDYASYQP